MENGGVGPQQQEEEQKSTREQRPQRVVSLLGGSTETLFRLGLGEKLVGRSHECDYPPVCLSLPCVSRPRLDVEGSSSEIDDAVRTISASGEPVYKLDDPILSDLKPDLIIAQDHCRVCAVTPDEMDNSAACLNVPQLVVRPETLADCLKDVTTIADAMGYSERGAALYATLSDRMERVRDLVAAGSSSSASITPRVALLEWCDPIMGCGYWLPELVEVAGGTALHCPPPGGATPTISFESLMDSAPDVVVFALCGFGVARAARELGDSWGDERIQKLREICDNRVFVVDGNYLVNRSGPRVVESAEALAEAIHPRLRGHFGHFGTDLLATLDHALAIADAGETTGSQKVRPLPLPEREKNGKNHPIVRTSSENEENMPLSTPDCAVEEQLRFLREGNMTGAFSLNSRANRARWCGPERFVTVLKSHGDFCRLLSEPAAIEKSETSGGIATVRVSLPSTEEKPAVGLIWTMVSEVPEDGGTTFRWRTEKVGMAQ